MSTGFGTTVEKLDLSDFEFEIPCDIKKRGSSVACPHVAEWVLVLRKHCESDKVRVKLICRPHYLYLVNGGTAYCSVCDTSKVVVRDYVLRLERIKP